MIKLFGFAALLALVFGVATVAGGAVGPDRSDDAAERADTPGGHGDAAPAHGDGDAEDQGEQRGEPGQLQPDAHADTAS